MNDVYRYILNTLEQKYTVDSVFRENENCRVVSYYNKENENNKVVLIVSGINNGNVFKSLLGEKNSHLPEIYDYCIDGDETVILEQFIPGCRLSDILAQKNLTKAQAIGYCIDICDALEFLHNKKIIHRDIKPSNVIINPNDEAVLIDLQTARCISDGRRTDTKNLGTVGYAAPEQFGIIQSMPATDIYALGVILNEMLLGEHPSVKTPDGRLGDIIEKCTHTQIMKRYQSVEELKKDLLKYKKLHR